MLKINNLDVYYDKVQVIWDILLEVQNNEAVGIFGPNGAGKSTLIKAILGLVDKVEGEISFKGEKIINSDTFEIARKGIALVPQNRELFPGMTVEENLRLGAAFMPAARNQIQNSLESVYEIFPILHERGEQLAGTMSGGQQRMLTVGRALMAKPQLLILDEPSIGLQPSLVLELFQKLKEIKKQDVSIILAEQNVRQGLKVIDRGYVLENGKIIIEESAENLLDNEHIQQSYLGI
ncbi:MAG: ABC transporter ATP-binding protein [Bacillota bacterium]